MNKQSLRYILLVSLLLNFSFLGAAGYTHYRQTGGSNAPIGHSVQGRAPSGSATQAHVFEALELNPDQRKVLHEKAGLFHSALDDKQARVAQLRASLLDLMRADKPDRMAIDSAIAEINAVQQQLQEMIVTHMLEFKSVLEREQQKKFFDLIRAAMAQVGEMRCQ